MRDLTFLGASSDIVTGSSYLLNDDKGGILIDMGMFQGTEETEKLNHKELTFDASKVHTVLLTHAHLDHVGRLAMLVRNGFTGKIYMTPATRALAEVVMLDAAKIALGDIDRPVLYGEEDVFNTLSKIQIVDYHQKFKIGESEIHFRDAGHILGSASILINDGKQKIIFSGDLGNSPDNIVKPTEFFEEGDLVIMESTYGDKNHPLDNPDETIQREINLIEQTGATLLVPSFAIERTQVLLHKINHLKKSGLIRPETRVYLDSPMALKATDIYKAFPDLFNEEMKTHYETGHPFDFDGLRVIENVNDSRKIKRDKDPKVIISGSGMMAGGRILNHAIEYLPYQQTRLLIVGFQAEGTIGRQIAEGARIVEIYDRKVKVNAHKTELYSMSAHADQHALLKWLGHIRGVKKVFLTHGEKIQRDTLAEKIKNELSINEVEKPLLDQTFNL